MLLTYGREELINMINADTAEHSIQVGNTMRYGRFQQGDRGQERDIKPLEWIVLDVRDGHALLLTKQGIDVRWYH